MDNDDNYTSVEAVLRAHERLLAAVEAVYYSARWTSDRLDAVAEGNLWTELRDAAGFEPGSSPKPLAYPR